MPLQSNRPRRSSMEKAHFRFYARCVFILAIVSIWWLLFAFHFSTFPIRMTGSLLSNAKPEHSPDAISGMASAHDSGLHRRSASAAARIHPDGLDNEPPPRRRIQMPKHSAVPRRQPFWRALVSIANRSDPCAGRYIYMHDLPPEFNQDLLDDCRQLSPWTNMCKYTENAGLGPVLEDPDRTLPERGWYATNQFAVDVIFHNRMKQYECLTTDSGKAAVLYVPFYAGLDIARHLWGANVTVRDRGPARLASWLRSRPEWQVMGGRDHFVVGGRITWDFRRLTDKNEDWGNKLLYIAEIMNTSMLMVEKSPYHRNDFGIPYPTYFHPTQDSDITEWQHRVRMSNRSSLFAFAGAPRPELATSIRGQIMDQCKISKSCNLLECNKGESKCHVPTVVMKLFEESVFCLQPQGDSYTRRSIFDSMVAGCIPVFFHEHSAYSQYVWHLPQNHSKYSVYIPEDDIRSGNVSIEAVLLKFSPAEVEEMREEVIRLIPGLVYNDPRHKLTQFKDAFDLTVKALIDRVTKLRIRVMEGTDDFVAVAAKDAEDIRASDLVLSQREERQWEGERRNGEHDTKSS